MAKKRNCRRTEEEEMMHERAVKLRKMTDAQLCRYIEDEKAQGIEDAYKRGYEDAAGEASNDNSVREFIDKLKCEKIAGIGAVTISKLLRVAEENGYM